MSLRKYDFCGIDNIHGAGEDCAMIILQMDEEMQSVDERLVAACHLSGF